MAVKKKPVLQKADYTEEELSQLSEYRKKIAEFTGEEWAMEWDRVTSRFKKKGVR